MGIQTIKIPLQSATVKPYIKQGDTIPAWSPSATNWGFDLTAETTLINMQLYSDKQQVGNYSKGNGITVINATTFRVDEIETNNFPIGCLKGDLEIRWVENGKNITFTFFNLEYEIIRQYTIT